jgi:hypothetical protein
MISPHIRFDHLDPATWKNTQRLLIPPSASGARRGGARTPPAAPLVLFVDGARAVKVLRPGAAPPNPRLEDYPWSGAWSLGRLRRSTGAPWAVAIEEGALERVLDHCDAHLRHDEDGVAQSLHLWRALQAEVGKGLHVDPDSLARVPVPPYAALQKTIDTLLPDGRSAALMVFDGPAVWASVIAAKERGDVVRVTTHAALGVPRPDFRRGAHRELLQAMEARVARPHVAAFMTLGAWREVASSRPGALAQKVATGEAVIDPAPAWLLALTGMGAVAGVAQGASQLLGRFVPASVKNTARAVIAQGPSPFAALGFDPISVFIELRKLTEPH